MAGTPSSSFLSSARAYVKYDGEELQPLPRSISEKIVQAASRREKHVRIAPSSASFSLFPFSFYNLENMKATPHCLPLEEVDLIIVFPWDSKCLLAMASAGDALLRRRVLMMALDRMRRPPWLRKFLESNGLPTCTIKENPHLAPGHAPYDNFVESLHALVGGSGHDYEMFVKSAADDVGVHSFENLENAGIRIVFHGTNHAVMEAIMQSGLDPSCRQGGRTQDFFGVLFTASLEFTIARMLEANRSLRRALKLLVFMVLKPYVDMGTAISSESNHHQLPLAKITLPPEIQ